MVRLRLEYDQPGSGLRRILGVEFPAGKVVTVAPRVAGLVVAKMQGLPGVDVKVVEGEPEAWSKPERPDPNAWDEVVRLPQADPDRKKPKAPSARG